MKKNGRGPGELRCPTCGGRADYDGEHFPFCCKRCKLIDLGRWFNEEYAIPAEEEDDDSPAPPSGAGEGKPGEG